MLLTSLVLYYVSGLPVRFLLTRLRAPGLFLLVAVILLPFLTGPTVLFRIGPLALRKEGSLQMLLVVALPALLADMTLFSYR